MTHKETVGPIPIARNRENATGSARIPSSSASPPIRRGSIGKSEAGSYPPCARAHRCASVTAALPSTPIGSSATKLASRTNGCALPKRSKSFPSSAARCATALELVGRPRAERGSLRGRPKPSGSRLPEGANSPRNRAAGLGTPPGRSSGRSGGRGSLTPRAEVRGTSRNTARLMREAMAKLRREAGGRLDDDAALLLMARQVLGGPKDPGRSNTSSPSPAVATASARHVHASGEHVEVGPECSK